MSGSTMRPEASDPRTDPRDKETPLQRVTGDALEDGLDRPWLTGVLLTVVVGVHLALGARMWSSGRPLWEALLWPRGKRLLTRAGALNVTRITEHFELWRLTSATFLHGDALHLALNGVALFFLGRLCESIYGPIRALFLFVCTGTIGFAFSWLYREDGGLAADQVSVGASGAIFGMLGAGIVFGWKYRDALPEGQGTFFRRNLAPWVLLNLLAGVVINRLPWMEAPIVDNLAHLGGLLAGTILAMTLGNRVVPGEQGGPVPRALMAVFCGICLSWSAWGVFSKWAA